jgi:hypothetical protein
VIFASGSIRFPTKSAARFSHLFHSSLCARFAFLFHEDESYGYKNEIENQELRALAVRCADIPLKN